MSAVLIPTDFSEASYNAARYGMALARCLDASLLFLHAYEVPYNFSVRQERAADQMEHEARAQMAAFVQKLAPTQKHQVAIERGTLIEAIHRLVAQTPMHLVVMGATGASGIKKALVGSNTIEAIKNAVLPVLSVPVHATAPPSAIHILATHEKNDLPIWQQALPLANSWQIELFSLVLDHDDDAEIKQNQKAYQDLLTSVFDRQIPHTVLDDKGAKEALDEYLAQHENPLLVVRRTKTNWLERLFNNSRADKLAAQAECAVWVFPA